MTNKERFLKLVSDRKPDSVERARERLINRRIEKYFDRVDIKESSSKDTGDLLISKDKKVLIQQTGTDIPYEMIPIIPEDKGYFSREFGSSIMRGTLFDLLKMYSKKIENKNQ